jgi:hypothetical protein
MVEHLSDEHPCITNTVSCFPANEYRYFVHSISPAMSDTCGNGIYVGIPGTGFGSQVPQAGGTRGEIGEQQPDASVPPPCSRKKRGVPFSYQWRMELTKAQVSQKTGERKGSGEEMAAML